MDVIVDTREFAPADRLEVWIERTSECFFPLEVRARGSRPFVGAVTMTHLGAVTGFRVRCDANTVRRTVRGIALWDPERISLALVRRGRCHFSQDGRSCAVQAGEFTALDSSRPHTLDATGGFDLTVLSFPKAVVGPHSTRIARRTALGIRGTEGLASLAVPFFCGVVDQGHDATDEVARHEVGASLVAMLRGLYSLPETGGPDPRRPTACALLGRIKAHIDQNIGDPDLTAARIAGAHFISTRYVHKLFELEGMSVSAWIRQRRLEGMRDDLLDPGLAEQPIAQIARRWGVRDAARASRLFRAAYGRSPREFRAAPDHDALRLLPAA